MRYWVFNESQLTDALARFADDGIAAGDPASEMEETLIRVNNFLRSPALLAFGLSRDRDQPKL